MKKKFCLVLSAVLLAGSCFAQSVDENALLQNEALSDSCVSTPLTSDNVLLDMSSMENSRGFFSSLFQQHVDTGAGSGSSASNSSAAANNEKDRYEKDPNPAQAANNAKFDQTIEEKNGVYGAPTDSDRITGVIGEETSAQKVHTGVDIGATEPGQKGDPIYAVADGVITRDGVTENSGSTRIEQTLPYTDNTAVYQHLDPIVQAGDEVERGDIIGYMSDNGSPDEVHLHYEIRVDGNYDKENPEDPLDHMPPEYRESAEKYIKDKENKK